jgi:hypothetical protein
LRLSTRKENTWLRKNGTLPTRPNRILVVVSRAVAVTPDRSRAVAVTPDRNRVAAVIPAVIPDRSRAVAVTRGAILVRSPVAAVIPDRSRVADDNPNPLTFSEPDDFVRLFFWVELH